MIGEKRFALCARLAGALLAGVLLLSACNPAAGQPLINTPQGGGAAQGNAATPLVPTVTRIAPAQAPAGQQSMTLDVSAVAQVFTSQLVEAVSAGGEPGWQAMPQYTLLSLPGYPVANHLKMAQIFIFPVGDLGVNEQAARQAQDLAALLESQQPADQMPYLPLESFDKQALHAQVKYLDFAGGKGVRFLTQWGNGLAPVNNRGLLYTFQGLTSDGKYYLAAVLPVHLAGLPPDSTSANQSAPPAIQFPEAPAGNLSDAEIQKFGSQFRQYITDTASMLAQQPDGSFTPDLAKLDAMIQSITIQ